MKERSTLVFALVIILLAFGLSIFFPPVEMEGDFSNLNVELVTFKEIDVNFKHEVTEMIHPFGGGAVIDIDNDGKHEIFVGGSKGQGDALFSYRDGRLVDIISNTGLSSDEATYGVISLDVDNDGYVDLIVARGDGLFIYFNKHGEFVKKEVKLNLEEDAVVMGVAPGDINNDGYVDLYVSTFIKGKKFKSATFNEVGHGKANIFLLNNKDNTFTDITSSSGVDVRQNTFLSVFVDLNDDKLQDLVVSPNTDSVRIFKNLGNLKFEEVESPTDLGFWMGLGVADIDNDGDLDLFLSNSGNFVPSIFLRGDLRDDQVLDTNWALLRNDGDFKFTQLNKDKGLDGQAFAFGGVFEDFNLDGRMDLIVVENYIKWWAYKVRKASGKLFVQDEDGNFIKSIKYAGLENKNYGQSPLISDINDDGYPDVIYLNMDGPVRALLNERCKNNYIKVVVPDNVESLGAKVTVTKKDGSKLSRVVVAGTGFMTDQTNELFFGLGKYRGLVDVKIELLSGKVRSLQNIKINKKIKV